MAISRYVASPPGQATMERRQMLEVSHIGHVGLALVAS